MSPSEVIFPFYGSANKMTIRDSVTSFSLLRLFIPLLEKQYFRAKRDLIDHLLKFLLLTNDKIEVRETVF